MQQAIISVQNLSVDFLTNEQTIHALQSISFSIDAGKTLALVGESGSGKSVSALSIIGLLPKFIAQIKQGRILFQEENKKQINLLTCTQTELEHIRGNKIGFIFQEPMTSLNPLMTCGKQVAETIMLHTQCSKSQALQQTISLFEEVKLPNPQTIIDRYPHELSGGQKQRVMIAIAICCNPSLLIADEPTTALDVTVQKTILELLKELQQKKGMAILFITHDLNLVKHFADDVMVLYKSKCVEYKSATELFSNPQEAYTKGLLACRPSSTERVHYLKTVQEIISGESVLSKKNNFISPSEYKNRIKHLTQTKPILELKDVHVWYPTKTNFFGKTTSWFKAVNGVNLTLHEGETLGLVGESGCGKTSIGKAIVKLADVTNGSILYKGKPIQDFSKSELADYRKNVQIIFQDPFSSLNPRVSVGNAILEPMHVHGIYNANNRKEKVIELLQKVDLLPEHFTRYPHEFSGGQRQRVCIARSLASQSKVLICDESVSALDVSVQAQVLNLLVSLREEFQLSYLFISHDLGVVKHISDQVAVMQKGLIVEFNDAENLYKQATQTYTKELIASSFV